MSRRRHTKTLGRRRARALAGKWADAHRGFPFYGVHWFWWAFVIIPTAAWGVSTIVRGPVVYNPETNTWERKSTEPAG